MFVDLVILVHSLGFVYLLQPFLPLLLNPHSLKAVAITLKKKILGPA